MKLALLGLSLAFFAAVGNETHGKTESHVADHIQGKVVQPFSSLVTKKLLPP